MHANAKRASRILHVCLGFAVIGAGIAFRSWLGLLGIIPLGAAVFGYCPASSLLGAFTSGKSAEGGECCAKDGGRT
ncbi:MAG: DUF2892 domain-containing protein [Bdellovibrionota bacterium]